MGLIRRLLRDRRGTAGIEAGLVIPFMLLILFGMIELDQLVSADHKAVSAAQSLADLVAQETMHTTRSLEDIEALSATILEPLDYTGLSITIASVGLETGTGAPRLLWQFPVGSDPLPVVDAQGLGDPGESVVMVRLAFHHRPRFEMMLGEHDIAETAFARPRLTRRIALNGELEQ